MNGALRNNWPKMRGVLAYGLGPVLGLASGPLLARAMGPEGRGQFAAIMQPLTLAGAIASIGIPAAVTYFMAQGKFNNRSILVRGLIISAFFAAASYLALVIYSEQLSLVQDIPRNFLMIIWLLVFASAAVQIRRGFLQGGANWKTLDLERFSFAVLRFVVVAALALIGISSAETYAIGSLAAFLAGGFIVWWPIRSKNREDRDSRPKVSYSALTGYSLSAALGTIAVVANNRLDQVLLPIMAPSHEVGFYAIAVTVAEVPIILGTLAARDALYQSSRGDSPLEILKSSRVYLIGSVGLGILLSVLAPYYMAPVFGADFDGAVRSVQVLAVGTIFACFAMAFTAIISGCGRPALSSLIPLCGLVLTVGLFIFYASDMSSVFAAFIAAVSQAISVVVGIILLAIFKIRPRKVETSDKQYSSL